MSQAVAGHRGLVHDRRRTPSSGKKCPKCGTFAFPPTAQWCPNPACMNDSVETVELSRQATVWSYTDARYQPPPPYITVD